MAGLDKNGLTIKTLAVIKDEIDVDLKAVFGDQINTRDETIFGQFKGIAAERESLIWELLEAVYNSQYPDTAQGTSLDNIAALSALTRFAAEASKVEGQALFGTIGTVVPVGTVFSVSGSPTTQFAADTEITLGVGGDEVQDIDFSAPPTSGSFALDLNGQITALIQWNDNAAAVQTALNNLSNLSGVVVVGDFTAGFTITFSGSDGKQPQALLVEDSNTLDAGGVVVITIVETTLGIYQGQVDCTSIEAGPKIASAKTLSIIDNPIAGLDSVFNPVDAIIGRDEETDSEYRIRRRDRIITSQAGPTGAIRNSILKLNDDTDKIPLQSVLVFENVTTAIDFRGLPPKSIEAFVYQEGGTTTRDQEIAEAILPSKAGGIEAHGDIPFILQDSQGFDKSIKFSRPTGIDIYLELDLTITAAYPSDGDSQVKSILVNWGNSLGVGQDVIIFPTLVAQLDAVPGITDVIIRIGIAPAPVNDDNIVIDNGTAGNVEISLWETAKITVNIV